MLAYTELAYAADCGLHFGAYDLHVKHIPWLKVLPCTQWQRGLCMQEDIQTQ